MVSEPQGRSPKAVPSDDTTNGGPSKPFWPVDFGLYLASNLPKGARWPASAWVAAVRRVGGQAPGHTPGALQPCAARRVRLKSTWLEWLKRRWPLVLVVVGFIILIILSRNDLERLAAALARGDPLWIGAAVAAQTAYYYLYAAQYKYAFATVEVASQVNELIPVMFASIFVRTLVPSGGASGAVVFVDDAARRGQSPALATEGTLLVLALDLSTMVPLILYSLVYLVASGTLRIYQVIGSVFFIMFIAALITALFTGRWAPGLLERALTMLRVGANHLAHSLGREEVLPPDWPRRTAEDLRRAANDIFSHRQSLLRTAGVATAAQLTNLVTVTFVGLAYGQRLGISTTIAAFSMDAVFSVVAIVPNGLIVAEAVMTEVFSSLGLPFEVALVITLVYRGLSVWLPLLVGFLFLRQVRALGGRGR